MSFMSENRVAVTLHPSSSSRSTSTATSMVMIVTTKSSVSLFCNHPWVLCKIFKFLNLEDLKHCRQVNTHWANVAVQFIMIRMQNIVFYKMGQLVKFNKLVKYNYENHPFQRFSFNFPFSKFCLLDKNVQKFFHRCSDSIRELRFSTFNWKENVSLADTHCILFRLCPFIESLVNLPMRTKYTCCERFQLSDDNPAIFEHLTHFTLYDNGWYTPTFVVDLLLAMPHLRVLTFRDHKSGQPLKVREESRKLCFERRLNIFNIVHAVLNNGGLQKLAEFDCDPEYFTANGKDLAKLMDVNMKPLMRFCAKLTLSQIDCCEEFSCLLEMNQAHLTSLDIRTHDFCPKEFPNWRVQFREDMGTVNHDDHSNYDAEPSFCVHQAIRFPLLERLTDLTLHFYLFSERILDHAPQLERLSLVHCCCHKMGQLKQKLEVEAFCFVEDIDEDDLLLSSIPVKIGLSSRKIYPSLTFLKIPLVVPSDICSFAKCFPNLTRLELAGTDGVMQAVYTQMSGLEELKIVLEPEMTDLGFTGVHPSKFVKVKKRDILKMNMAGLLFQCPYIGCLKELRRLELELQVAPHWNRITDFSVLCGMLHLGKLNCVIIPRDLNLGDKSFRALAYLPLLRVLYIPSGCRLSMGTLCSLTLPQDQVVQVIVRNPAIIQKQSMGVPFSFRRIRISQFEDWLLLP